jgi:hypothetical protein
MTSASNVTGAIVLLRKYIKRSVISATAAMDAKIRNQMGQPAASIIVNTQTPRTK